MKAESRKMQDKDMIVIFESFGVERVVVSSVEFVSKSSFFQSINSGPTKVVEVVSKTGALKKD